MCTGTVPTGNKRIFPICNRSKGIFYTVTVCSAGWVFRWSAQTIRLSTTTSVKDSGLLDNLLPVFEQEYGYTVEVQSAGTGKAIAAAKYGNADVILVHAKV